VTPRELRGRRQRPPRRLGALAQAVGVGRAEWLEAVERRRHGAGGEQRARGRGDEGRRRAGDDHVRAVLAVEAEALEQREQPRGGAVGVAVEGEEDERGVVGGAEARGVGLEQLGAGEDLVGERDGRERARGLLEDPLEAIPDAAPAAHDADLARLHAVPVELAVEIGRTRMTIGDTLGLGPGSIITLNRMAGEPVDLLVDGRPIARGEVVVIDEEFGLRVTEVLGAAVPGGPAG